MRTHTIPLNGSIIIKTIQSSENQSALAFAWAVTGLLSKGGVVGLVLPATAVLFNKHSERFRQRFFKVCGIRKVVNLSNLREKLFDSADVSSSMLCVYSYEGEEYDPDSFVHYAPFGIHQASPTSIAIHEFEISTLSQKEAQLGDSVFWKLAQWGNLGDRRTLKAIKDQFSVTLKELLSSKSWKLTEGPQLRKSGHHFPELAGKARIDKKAIQKTLFRFSIPDHALKTMMPEECFLRRPGAFEGTKAPLVLIPQQWMKGISFSLQDLVARNRSECTISSKTMGDRDALRALSVYLNSSLVAYCMFFESAQWGVDQKSNRRVRLEDIRNIPVPQFNNLAIKELSQLSHRIEKEEPSLIEAAIQREGKMISDSSMLESYMKGLLLNPLETRKIRRSVGETIRNWIDTVIYNIYNVPQSVQIAVDEFISVKCLLDSEATTKEALRPVSDLEIHAYGIQLKKELDGFIGVEHSIEFKKSYSYAICVISLEKEGLGSVTIREGDESLSETLSSIKNVLNRPISRWVSLQYGLKVILHSSIYLLKSPQRINWLTTQATEDAAEIIADSF